MIESLLMNKRKGYGSMSLGPGPTEVLGKIGDDLYFGPVDATHGFPSGSRISELAGVSQGTLQFDTNLVWLKFFIDGKVLFIARNNPRYSVSWDTLNNNGLVYGTKTVGFNGETFKVRLLKGDIADPSNRTRNYFDDKPDPTEWGRTLRRVASQIVYGTSEWDNYNAQELNFHSGTNGGSWTQETYQGGSTSAMIRGVPLNDTIYRGKTETSNRNWRPVLEWIG